MKEEGESSRFFPEKWRKEEDLKQKFFLIYSIIGRQIELLHLNTQNLQRDYGEEIGIINKVARKVGFREVLVGSEEQKKIEYYGLGFFRISKKNLENFSKLLKLRKFGEPLAREGLELYLKFLSKIYTEENFKILEKIRELEEKECQLAIDLKELTKEDIHLSFSELLSELRKEREKKHQENVGTQIEKEITNLYKEAEKANTFLHLNMIRQFVEEVSRLEKENAVVILETFSILLNNGIFNPKKARFYYDKFSSDEDRDFKNTIKKYLSDFYFSIEKDPSKREEIFSNIAKKILEKIEEVWKEWEEKKS